MSAGLLRKEMFKGSWGRRSSDCDHFTGPAGAGTARVLRTLNLLSQFTDRASSPYRRRSLQTTIDLVRAKVKMLELWFRAASGRRQRTEHNPTSKRRER